MNYMDCWLRKFILSLSLLIVGNRNSVQGIAAGYRRSDRGILVLFAAWTINYSLLHSVQTGYGSLIRGVMRPGLETDNLPKLCMCGAILLFVPYAFVACPGAALFWTLSPRGLFAQIIIALLVLCLVVVLCDLFTHIRFLHEEECGI
jgi:hypothetical protein